MFRYWPLLLIAFPALELYVLILVGSRIGALTAIALVILSTMAGLALLRARGARVFSRFQREASEGRIPSSPIMDTLCLMLAGWLFVFPGFVSDMLALSLLIPATRLGLACLLRRRMASGGFYGTVHTRYARHAEDGTVTWSCTGTGDTRNPAKNIAASRRDVIIDCDPGEPDKRNDSGGNTASGPGSGGEGGR